jgi:hypothetical protein
MWSSGLDEVRLREPGHEESGLLLAREVAEEGALRDVDGLGDLVDGGLLVALGGEQFEGGAQQCVPGTGLLALAQRLHAGSPSNGDSHRHVKIFVNCQWLTLASNT